MLHTIGAFAAPFLVASAGGLLFFFIHAPLPWTLGAITLSAIVAASGRPWLMKAWARNTVRPILGVLAGSFFTGELVGMIGLWWPSILLAVTNVLIVLLLGYFFLVHVAGFDRTTAFFASAPGGLGELVMMGASMGGDVRRVVLVHLIRVIFVVFLIPIGLQIYLGRPVGRTAPPGVAEATFADPQVQTVGMSRKVTHPTFGVQEMVAQGFNISGCSKDIRRPTPGVGEHNDEVHLDLGLKPAEIDELRRDKVI